MKAPLHLLILGALLCGALLPATANGQLDFLREWFGDLFGLSSDSSSSSPPPTDEDPHVSSSSIDSREIEEQVSSVLWGLDGRLGELLRDMGNFTRPLSEVSSWCYEPSLGGERGEGTASGSSEMMMNIFNGSARFRTVAVDYYHAFPHKEITHQRLESLLNSTRQMIEHCNERRQRRLQLQRNEDPVRFGFTVLSDWSLEEMQQLLGFHEPSNQFSSNNNNNGGLRGKRLTGNDQHCVADRSSGSPPRTHDWRRLGMVTSVKNSLRESKKAANRTGVYTTTASPMTTTSSSGRYGNNNNNNFNNDNNYNNNNGRQRNENDRNRDNNNNNYNDNSRYNSNNNNNNNNDNSRNNNNANQNQNQDQQNEQDQQQRGCAADWAFAVAGAIEGAMLVRRRTLRSNATLSLSEQQLLNCAVEDACRQGGDAGTALSYVKNYGLSEEKAVPYVGGNGPCPYAAIDYFYPIDEYCVRSRFRYSYQSLTEQVDDAEMQRILVQMGPLYVVVDGRPELFRNYRSGVVDESEGCSNGGQVNHAVLLVGYTEDAWLLRDSYGRRWGEEGYFRLARGRNVCGVNSEIAWPLI